MSTGGVRAGPALLDLDRLDRPAQEVGQLLWPEKVTQANLEDLKVTLGSYRYAGQYQQRPSPAEGGILKRYWWRYWQPAHLDLPPVQVRMPRGRAEHRRGSRSRTV